jgi:IclR family transcriptional regulator, acetate operon repressor
MRSGDRGAPNSVIGRAMTVLTCYGPADEGLSLTELTRRSGLAKPTVYRLLVELAGWQLVERSGRQWRLGIKLFELGQMVPRQRELRTAARPFLRGLHEATGSTIHLAILDGAQVVYIEKLEPAGSPGPLSRAGGLGLLHCTGIGKALLAYSPDGLIAAVIAKGFERRTPYTIAAPGILLRQLEDIRRANVAYDREESALGVTCVASPVIDGRGIAVAAVSVSGSTTRLRGSRIENAVQAAASGIAAELPTLTNQEITSLDPAC